MRLRIVHQLSLLLAGIAILSTAAVGGLAAWNLRSGFSDYLRSRDTQQLERFAQVVADRAGLGGAPLQAPLRMGELLDEFRHRDGQAPPPEWRPPPQGPIDGGGPGEAGPPRRRPPPPGADPGGLGRRVQVVDLQGTRLGGPPVPPGRPVLEQPVKVRGETVAVVRMLPSETLEDVDTRFLRRQYIGLAGAFLGSLALALAAAVTAARWIGSPLRKVQAATHRIARGELELALPESGSREMAALIADVNRMAASLQRLEGARRRWIAQISHELRTPLSVLLGELESVQDGVRANTPELVASLREEVMQLVRLVGDLHTLSMADLRALPCELTEGDVGAVLERVAMRMTPRLAQAGIALALAPGPKAQACWDFGRITQLVTNLLENSLRYTHAPGRVDVRWTLADEIVTLHVDDSPPGIEPAELEHIFEPLYRADAARQRTAGVAGGSGLGLAICRAIVQAHGGSIQAAASPLGGLGIEVRLPLQPPGAA